MKVTTNNNKSNLDRIMIDEFVEIEKTSYSW